MKLKCCAEKGFGNDDGCTSASCPSRTVWRLEKEASPRDCNMIVLTGTMYIVTV